MLRPAGPSEKRRRWWRVYSPSCSGYWGRTNSTWVYSGQGALLLVLFILGIPLMFLFGVGIIVWLVIGIITLVEGIIYLTKPDAAFEETYVKGRKAWF